MEFMRSAVQNLQARIHSCEDKIRHVEDTLKNQNPEIREQVMVEKSKWMS